MPAKSKKQLHLMQAVAHNPAFAKKVGIPKKVGEEFSTMKVGGEVKKKFKLFGGSESKEEEAAEKKSVKSKKEYAEKEKSEPGETRKFARGGAIKKMAVGRMVPGGGPQMQAPPMMPGGGAQMQPPPGPSPVPPAMVPGGAPPMRPPGMVPGGPGIPVGVAPGGPGGPPMQAPPQAMRPMKKGGSCMKKGGSVTRGDGIVSKGHTKGRFV